MDENPSFIPELKEVKQILEIDLDELLREDVIQEKEMVVGKNTGQCDENKGSLYGPTPPYSLGCNGCNTFRI